MRRLRGARINPSHRHCEAATPPKQSSLRTSLCAAALDCVAEFILSAACGVEGARNDGTTYSAPHPFASRATASAAGACVTGIISTVLMLTRAGRVATQWTASAMSSGVNASAPS